MEGSWHRAADFEHCAEPNDTPRKYEPLALVNG